MHFSAVKRDCNPVSHASVTPVPPAGTAEWRANALFIVRYTLLTGTEGSPGTPCSVSTPSALSYDKRFPLGDPPRRVCCMLHTQHRLSHLLEDLRNAMLPMKKRVPGGKSRLETLTWNFGSACAPFTQSADNLSTEGDRRDEKSLSPRSIPKER